MHIAYVLGQFPSYTETFIANEIDELHAAGLNICILSLNKGSLAANTDVVYDRDFFDGAKFRAHLSLITRLRVHYFRILLNCIIKCGFNLRILLKYMKNFSSAVYLVERIKALDIKHVHAHFMSTPTDVAMILSMLLNIPLSCTGHANDIYTASEKDLKEKMAYSKFVVTCTAFNKAYLTRCIAHAQQGKIHHIYHGIHVSKWIRKKGLEELTKKDKINLLLVGRLVAKKGIDYLLEAMLLLRQSDYSIACTIIGDGPQHPSLTQFIKQHKLRDLVTIQTSMPQDHLQKYYLEADIFVLPSLIAADGDRDGLPNVLLEAMAVGVPIIATDVSAIGELIQDERTGLLIHQRDPQAIARAVIRMIEDYQLCRNLSEAGKQHIETFDIQESTNKLLHLFNGN
ncbi:glycosyltransferase family 4 protein [Sphingobacterium paludis]|uniref:Glycosyltransferase involved in cell wall biosynthesis n=1 Tax=Sphingobacterium paludis TaxID=1476465 RepID=A0A4R7D1F6_9SPHI|nr:glycosyltransferase family 4 protein [Sphingobacterium paludis]TDS13881.1 glycosyltransferase involved in cell wall biosynthesis [Sphingobacterium paludis]